MKRLALLRLLALAALALVALPGAANAWWNSDWSNRKKITIDASPTGAALQENLGPTAVLIRLSDGNFKFTEAKDDGSDIRFVAADDKTPLKYHIEKYDNLFGVGLIWVEAPEIKAGATQDVWMYWGDSAAQATGDSKTTYDPNMLAVYHFADKSGPPQDATSFANHATATAAAIDAGSLVGAGLKFDGTGTVALPPSPSLAFVAAQPLTLSAWIRVDAAQPNTVLFARHDGAKAFLVGLDNQSPFVSINTGSAVIRTPAAPDLAPTVWHHLAVTVGQKINLYVDGAPVASVDGALPDMTGPSSVGGDAAGGAANFNGGMDELQLSKSEASASAIRAAVVGQGPDAKLIAYGNDEQTSSWSNGYFATILHSVTLDGWVVIGILAVMLVVSILVMINKARYVNRVTRANETFLTAFRSMITDPSALDRMEPQQALSGGRPVTADQRTMFTDSPLYRLYAMGSQELRNRFSTVGAQAVHRNLSAQSIAAIKATLDAGMTRESQRLNRLMVLLTIAISGGPFLGLLGTVVGVMITFAAIAASGDVNVNAIAPGIAAALVATVAGLAVAIPALFGYNYLLTRIKDATADMQVFVDEYTTKMAEFYSV